MLREAGASQELSNANRSLGDCRPNESNEAESPNLFLATRRREAKSMECRLGLPEPAPSSRDRS